MYVFWQAMSKSSLFSFSFTGRLCFFSHPPSLENKKHKEGIEDKDIIYLTICSMW